MWLRATCVAQQTMIEGILVPMNFDAYIHETDLLSYPLLQDYIYF